MRGWGCPSGGARAAEPLRDAGRCGEWGGPVGGRQCSACPLRLVSSSLLSPALQYNNRALLLEEPRDSKKRPDTRDNRPWRPIGELLQRLGRPKAEGRPPSAN
ncbi:hypothetical protein NDU88_004802 [Pleurodeles waltl]|uniref:Uncharacterized protein n=1 Tax=Pleurodeles waltl TaxID=8319 RepID=A0AAV7TSJ3_PLEWA|nr:hypothetical protein NDU88_004802 [Pleurodeles waltl]